MSTFSLISWKPHCHGDSLPICQISALNRISDEEFNNVYNRKCFMKSRGSLLFCQCVDRKCFAQFLVKHPSLLANMKSTWCGFVIIKPGGWLGLWERCNKDDGLFRINSEAPGCLGGVILNLVARTYEGIEWLYSICWLQRSSQRLRRIAFVGSSVPASLLHGCSDWIRQCPDPHHCMGWTLLNCLACRSTILTSLDYIEFTVLGDQ